MRYVITGSAGHISGLLAVHLLNAGHEVTLIGRDRRHLEPLINAGARHAVGSVEDADFLNEAFAGHDAAYTMCPHSLEETDVTGYYERLGRNYANAIEINNIRYVVNLSSVGAHLPEGAGPISGLNRVESELNKVANLNVMHLRPGYFYYNFLDSIDMVKEHGVIGADFSVPPDELPLVRHTDIALVAANELTKLAFEGSSVKYVASDEAGTDEIAAVLGRSIGKPDLQWTKFTSEQALDGMLQVGVPRELAESFGEMSKALDRGVVMEDYRSNKPPEFGSVKLEHFAENFAKAYGG